MAQARSLRLTRDNDRVHRPTIDFYELNAHRYAGLTSSVDLSQLRSRFIKHLPPHARVLDVGCGAGRDLRAFKAAGFEAEGIEPAPALARIAREFSGCPVSVTTIDKLEANGKFDGVWACASLLHLRVAELPEALARIRRALRDPGIFFMSMQRGAGENAAPDGRFYCLYEESEILDAVNGQGFVPLDVWESGDALPERQAIRWINLLARSSQL